MSKKMLVKNSIIGILIMLLLMLMPNSVKAAQSRYFGITELRESGMGYSIGDPGTNGTNGGAAKIWNIVEYADANGTGPTDTNVYCVKAGVGFTSGSG